LLPEDVLQRSMWRGYASIAAAGAAMTAVALALSRLNAYAAAAAALLAYAACLWLTGGLDRSQLELLYSLVKRNRAAPAH
jgi:hypothetical protein